MQPSDSFLFLMVAVAMGLGGFLIFTDFDITADVYGFDLSLYILHINKVWAHDGDGDGIDDDTGLPVEDEASDDTFLLNAADFTSILNGSNVEPSSASIANGTATLTWSSYQERLRYTIEINGLNLDPTTDYNPIYENVTGVHIHVDDGGSDPHALNIFGLPTEDDGEMTFTTNGTGGTITGVWGDNDDDTSGSPADVGRGKQLSDMRDELCNGELYFQVHSTPGLEKAIRGSIDVSSPLCEFDLTKSPFATAGLSDSIPISLAHGIDDITDASGSSEFWYNANQTKIFYRVTFDGVDVGHGGTFDDHITKGFIYQDTAGHGDGGHGHGDKHLPVLLNMTQDAQFAKDVSALTLFGVWDDTDAVTSGGAVDATRSKKVTDKRDILCANDAFLNFTTHDHPQYFLTGHIHGDADYCTFDPLHNDFTATIDGSQIAGGDTGSSATGFAQFRFDDIVSEATGHGHGDGGHGSTIKLQYEINLLGLDTDDIQTVDTDQDDLTAVHIHNAPSGSNGPVHLLNIFGSPTPIDDDFVLTPGNGTITGIWTDDDKSTTPSENGRNKKLSKSLDELCDSNGYLNIHTEAFSGGEIRGQIEPTSDNVRCEFDLEEPDFVATLNATKVNATGIQTSDSTASAEAKFYLNDIKTKLHYAIDFSHDVDTTGHNVAVNGQTIDTVNDDLYRIHLHFGNSTEVGGSHAYNILRPDGDSNDMKINNGAKVVSGIWDSVDESSDPEHPVGVTLASVFDDLCSENLYLNIHSPPGTPNAAAMMRGQIEPAHDSTLCDGPSLIGANLINPTKIHLLFDSPVDTSSVTTGDFTAFDFNGTSIDSVSAVTTPSKRGLVTLSLDSAVDSSFTSSGTVDIASTLTSDFGIAFDTGENPVTIQNPLGSPLTVTESNSKIVLTSDSALSKLIVPDGVAATLDLSSSKTSSLGKTSVMLSSALNVTSGEGTSNELHMELPASLTVEGNTVDFDGVLSLPSVSTSCGSGVNSCVEIGSSEADLDLSSPVKIILPNQSGRMAFYVPQSGDRTIIDDICPGIDDPGTISSSGPVRECAIDSNGDKVIWTTHFTSFGSLSPGSNDGGSSGGGRGGLSSTLAPNLVLYNTCDVNSDGIARVIAYNHVSKDNVSVNINSGDFLGYAIDVTDSVSYLDYIDKSNPEDFTYRVFDAMIPSDIDHFWVGVFSENDVDTHVPHRVLIPKNTCQGFDEAFPLKEDAQFIKPFEPLEIRDLSNTQNLMLSTNNDNSDETKLVNENRFVFKLHDDMSSEPAQPVIDAEPAPDSIPYECGAGTIKVDGYCKVIVDSDTYFDSEPALDLFQHILKWMGVN